uniref:Replication protein A 70 kDa DNA-binding subunit B/D first OB fold domain-containing protein n=1 Tax=Noccaea caerulescens TaxID=107243 RepID=A0A1J3CDR5_NOCCA
MDSEGNSTMDFIFVDEEGTKMHATVIKTNYHHFRIALPEGEWREITRFQISNDNWNNPQFMVADHTYMIILRHETVVLPIQPLSDNHFFQFSSFERVISGRHDVNYPVDFIGVISYMGKLSPPVRNLEERRSLPFHLRSLSNTELYCIAYEDLAAQLYQAWKDNASEPLICVLSEWRVARSNRECFVIYRSHYFPS